MNSEKITVLAVDDEPTILEIYKMLIQQVGFEPLTASDLKSGLQLLNEHNPDIVLTDEELPDGNGLLLARASQARNLTRPIIVCSGSVSDDSELAQIATHVLHKPFSVQSLQQTLVECARTTQPSSSTVRLTTLSSIFCLLQEVDQSVYLADNNAFEIEFYKEYASMVRKLNDILPTELGVDKEMLLRLKDDTPISGRALELLTSARTLFEEFKRLKNKGAEKDS